MQLSLQCYNRKPYLDATRTLLLSDHAGSPTAFSKLFFYGFFSLRRTLRDERKSRYRPTVCHFYMALILAVGLPLITLTC